MFDFIAAFFCALFGFCGAGDKACRDETVKGNAYTICSFDMNAVTVRTYLDGAEGKPFARLDTLEAALKARGEQPLMLMNGGMYHSDLSPVGLYVEDGKETQRLSTKDGWGNFHLLPNGVFWVKDGKAFVTESQLYRKNGFKADFATQSGPMLVIKSELHSRFLKDSDSRKIRNGVGVNGDGSKVTFAISHGAVTFWEFGKLFQEHLKTPHALFLDGTVSAVRADGYAQGGWRELGPIVAVTKR